MSWMQRLYNTYEQAMLLPNIASSAKPMPICHTVQNAHIVITLDGDGNFRDANVLDKSPIVLPATEKSAGRTSSGEPHALADKIQYVAADYPQFGGKKKAYFTSYQQQLGEWVNSEFSHPSIKAIYAYISKQRVVADLIAHQIMVCDEQDVLLTQWQGDEEPPKLFKALPKETGGKLEQGSALVCWRVESHDIECPQTWLDTDLQQCWVRFDSQQAAVSDFCYVSGEYQPVALSHPAKLRHSGDKAKLISSNDKSGYTFRGRFTDNTGLQNAAVSSIATQKAHNALRWLINREFQTFKNGDQVVVTWALSHKEFPAPLSAIAEDVTPSLDDLLKPLDSDEPVADIGGDFTPDQGQDIGNRYAKRLGSYMNGYVGREGAGQIKSDEAVSILALDSATPGRMGITYYREMLPEEYIATVTQWHTDFAWPQRVSSKDTGVRWLVGAPRPKDILRAVYGGALKSGDSLSKQFYMRLLPCIVENQQLPKDFWERAFRRACNRQTKRLSDQYSTADSEYAAWEKDLAVACALYKGFTVRQKHGDIKMALDTSNTSRDYLYGRLLAVGEKIEEVALSAASVNRATAASRLMQRFTDKPASTWLTIYKQLDPYMRQLKVSRAGFLTNMNKELDQIMAGFEGDEFSSDSALKPEFLLGFHCQRLALSKKAQTETQQTETEEGI